MFYHIIMCKWSLSGAKIHIIFLFLYRNRENPTSLRGNPHFYCKIMLYFAAENKEKAKLFRKATPQTTRITNLKTLEI